MSYRTELLLGCIGLNFMTDIILWTYKIYSPKHIGLRIAIYGGILLIAWLLETHDPLSGIKWVINAARNSHNDRRHTYICNLIRAGEVRGKAKVIRIASHRGLR